MHTGSRFWIAGILCAAIAVIAVYRLSFACSVFTHIAGGAEIAVITGGAVLDGSEFTAR